MQKLAGHLPLADMIGRIIEDSRMKLAADEEGEKKDEKKDDKAKKPSAPPFGKKDDKKEEKKDDEEKKASAIDYSDPDEIDKLASALDQVGDQFVKSAADEDYHGGEFRGGGQTLAVLKGTPGKQPYKKDSSKSHNVPTNTGLQAGDGGAPAKTQVPNDHAKAPGGAAYPAKGVFKTASEGVLERLQNAAAALNAEKTAAPHNHEDSREERIRTAKGSGRIGGALNGLLGAGAGVAHGVLSGGSTGSKVAKGAAGAVIGSGLGYGAGYGMSRLGNKINSRVGAIGEKKKEEATKESSASPVDYILGKIANTEKQMGGMTLDSKSGDGPKPPSNPGRELIESNSAATNAKKVQAKAPQKKLMSQVLTEPALSKAHDSKVHENLRNAAKGGVKIAAARELLKKIAEEGCSCDGKGECKHCKMKKAMEKKSMGMSMSSSPPPTPMRPSLPSMM